MKKTFSGANLGEANRKADEWWAQQKGVRLVERTNIGLGGTGPSTANRDQWSVTINYEPESSN
jgi:hypothetical protein